MINTRPIKHSEFLNGDIPVAEDSSFSSMLEDYLEKDFLDIEDGTIVKGRVVRIDPDKVLVDVNFKSEGQIPIEEFQDSDGNLDVKEGDKVEVFVIHKNDLEGTISLSYKRAKKMRVLDELEKIQEENQNVPGKIVKRIKGGYTVEVLGIEAFLPGSHVDLRPVPDMDALVGERFDFRVLKINRKRSNVIVSRRVILEEEREQRRKELIST